MTNQGTLNRRQLVFGAAALAGGAARHASAAAPSSPPSSDTLGAMAASKGRFFGIATQARYFDSDPLFADLVRRECACLVPEWDMKWKPMQPTLGAFAPQGMDLLVEHAASRSLWLRGHTLFWHESLPDWFDAEVRSKADWDRVVVPYALYVGKRYGDRLRHWDVINEAVRIEDGRRDNLRKWRMTELFGDDYVRRAYDLAREVAPNATLFYNDFGLEYAGDWFEKRRAAVLRSLARWRRAGIPIGGFGMQSHLTAGKHKFAPTQLRSFLAEVAALGLEIVVSELDVSETDFDRPIASRDQAVADEAERFLDVALDQPGVSGILTWGLTDRYSWLTTFNDPRNRGLPYDENFGKKPLWHAMARAISGGRPSSKGAP